MDVYFDRADYATKADGVWLSLRIDRRQRLPMLSFVGKMRDGKKYIATLREKKSKRSLDANAMFWAGATLISEATQTPLDDVYIELVKRYGVRRAIIVKPEAAEQIAKTFRYCENEGEVIVNGQKGIQLMAYIGSSHYDTAQMSRLIDGMMTELEELEIDFSTPEEIERSKREWAT